MFSPYVTILNFGSCNTLPAGLSGLKQKRSTVETVDP